MSNKKKRDNKAIGVGPFLVPGIASFGFEANMLNIVLENPTQKQLRVTVKADQSSNSNNPQISAPIFPDTNIQENILRQSVTLLPMNSTIITVPIAPLKIYSVTISGDVGVADDEEKKMRVSILGGVKGEGNDIVYFPEPALCFGYEKFFTVEENGEDEDSDD